jgi:hypothetical protein
MRMHLDNFYDFCRVTLDHVDHTPFLVQVDSPLASAITLECVVMPTPHLSDFFQTIFLDIVDPLLKLNDQSLWRPHQVPFHCADIDPIDHSLRYY